MLVAVVAAVGLHAVAVWGLSLLPPRPTVCPEIATRCRAQCDGRALTVPARCPALPDCRCSLYVYEDLEPVEPEALVPPAVVEEPAVEANTMKEVSAEEFAPQPPPEGVPTEPDPAVTAKEIADARSIAVVKVLGSYGGAEAGTVLDVIESTDNDLGELFAQASGTRTAGGGEVTARGGGALAPAAGGQAQGLATSGTVVDRGPARVRGRATTSEPIVDGGLEAQAAAAFVRRRMGTLRACYERQLRVAPTLAGTVELRLELTSMGSVDDVEIVADTTDSPPLQACLVGKTKAWRFGSAEAPSTVRFSVVFSAQ